MTAILQRIDLRYAVALALGGLAGPLFVSLAGKSSPLAAAAALACLGIVAAGLRSPYVAVLLAAAVVPLERLGRFTDDSTTLTISLMRVVGLIGIGSFAIHWILGRRHIRITLPWVLYTVYTFIALLTFTHAKDFNRCIQQSATNIGNVLFLLLIINVLSRREQVKLPVILWLVMTLGIGIFSIYQWHDPTAVVQVDRYDNSGLRTVSERFSTVMMDYGEFENLGAVRRVLGPTSSPAVYGINIILTLPFYIYLWKTSRSVLVWLFCAAGLGVGAYNVILTNTRAAVIALIFCFFCIAVTRMVRLGIAHVLIAIILTAACIPFLPTGLQDRIFNAKNYSAEHSSTLRIRLTYWKTAIDIFADNWLFGIGAGNQTELPNRLRNLAMPANSSVHNEYIETLLETGVIGYPVMVAFMVVLYRRSRFAERFFYSEGDRSTGLFLTAIRVSFYSVLFYALQCDVLHFTLKGWWLIVGFIMVLSEMAVALAAKRQAPQEVVSG